jgi:hypothetical protein
MLAEQIAFGGSTFLLNRLPANILSWEPNWFPVWGIHDDHYATGNDAGTWQNHPWDRGSWTSDELQQFASQRSDQLPFSGEIGGIDETTQACDAFDAYSQRMHLNMMNIGFHTDFLSKEDCFRDITNRIGPAISLVHASLNTPLFPGSASELTLIFRNTGYSRLFTKVPVYFVVTDATGKPLSPDIFRPVRIPIDLTQLEGNDGERSIRTRIYVPPSLALDQTYKAALWLPDPDEKLRSIPEYNYLLNNKGVPNEETGLNVLFPFHF